MCLQQILDNKIIKYAIYICVVLLVISTTTCAIDKMDMLDNYSNEEGYIDWASIIFGKTTLNETKVILLADNSVRESSIRINDLFVGAFNSTDTLCFNYIDTINFLILGKYDCIYFTELGNDIIATGIRFYRLFSSNQIFKSIGFPEKVLIIKGRQQSNGRRIIIISEENGYILEGYEYDSKWDNPTFKLKENYSYYLSIFSKDYYEDYISEIISKETIYDYPSDEWFQDWQGYIDYKVYFP